MKQHTVDKVFFYTCESKYILKLQFELAQNFNCIEIFGHIKYILKV